MHSLPSSSRTTQLLKKKKFSEVELKLRMDHKKNSQMLEQYYAVLDEKDQAAAELKYLGSRLGINQRPYRGSQIT